MEQLVRVRRANPDGTAQVIHLRESACSGDCHKCSGCGAAKEAVEFTADNPIGARPGDLVRVESASGPVLKAAAVLYLLPLALFFLGYGLGAWLAVSGPLLAGLGFGLGVLFVILYDRRLQRRAEARYTITALEEKGGEDHG